MVGYKPLPCGCKECIEQEKILPRFSNNLGISRSLTQLPTINEDEVFTTPGSAPAMPYITHKGSMPIISRRINKASRRTCEGGPPKPPKGFKSLTIHGPLITILGKGPFPPYWQSIDLSLVTCLPRGLLPLCDFRRLRSLKLTGLLYSCQEIIFRACWLNPELISLTLVMALEPELTSRASKGWKVIKGKYWEMQEYQKVEKTYHGNNGQGILATKYGHGEYLDTKAIGKAHLSALPLEHPYEGKVKRKLEIQHLELGGFVVDSKAINDWFDPELLASIKFLDDCIDAGFSVDTEKFQHVKIERPQAKRSFPYDQDRARE